MKADILEIFKDFQSNAIINNVGNETYIALIAKKDKCDTTSDFKPISLTTALYKLIAKIIVERLKHTLAETVSEYQMAFVKGRQTTDAMLIANEAVNYWRAKKIKGFVIKLDIEKALTRLAELSVEN